jgi:predicted nucleotidyltransferase/DNA-binding XRE family transcriptional regulator
MREVHAVHAGQVDEISDQSHGVEGLAGLGEGPDVEVSRVGRCAGGAAEDREDTHAVPTTEHLELARCRGDPQPGQALRRRTHVLMVARRAACAAPTFRIQSQSAIFASMEQATAAASSVILRTARHRAGLTQRELADRAGVTQSVVSAYERGRREPSLSTLRRLVDATGHRMDVTTAGAAVPRASLRSLVERHRSELVAVAGRYGLTDLRLFGSAARREDGEGSDVDLLVSVPSGVGLFRLGRARRELEAVLGVPVDLVPDDGLKPHVRERVLREAVPV